MVRIHKNYIGGKWMSSKTGKLFESLNPATERSVGKFQKSDRGDVKNAITAAQKAFPMWRDTPAPTRAKYLFKIRDLLIKEKERLARLEVEEMGKVLSEARGDVQEAIERTNTSSIFYRVPKRARKSPPNQIQKFTI